MVLLRGTMGLSAVCDCGISRAYSLFLNIIKYLYQDVDILSSHY